MREPCIRRLLSMLLVLYPAGFRDAMGTDLVETVVQRWRDRGHAFWWRELPRFVVDGLLERIRTVPGIIDDLGGAWRQLRRNPGHHALATITLAVGVGATTTIFTIADAVVFRPLPYEGADRLYMLHSHFENLQVSGNSLPNLRAMQATVRTFSWLAGASDRSPAMMDAAGEVERVSTLDVTEEYLTGLGADVRLGRRFDAGDHDATAEPVVIIGHGLWQQRWGGDESVIGRTVLLDGISHVIVGVMSPSYRDPLPIESGAITGAWVPVREGNPTFAHRDNYTFRVIGRLDPAASIVLARTELSLVGRRLAADHPDANLFEGSSLEIVPYRLEELTVGDARSRVLLLLGAVVLLLLLSCANVANLFLVRGITRAQELAVRSALGATRPRLARQLFAESLLTAGVAGVLGGLLAAGGVRIFLAVAPADLPRLHEVALDQRVLLFLVALTVFTAVFFGTAPALRSTDVGLSGTRTTATRQSQRLQAGFVALEVALSLVLVAGSGLMLNSLAHLLRVDPGFDPANVLVVDSRPPTGADSDAEDLAFYSALMERARAMAGVSNAALAYSVPGPSGGAWSHITVDDDADARRGSERARAPAVGMSPGGDFLRINPVYGDFFEVLGIPLLAGSFFEGNPDDEQPMVVVLNAAAARQLFPGEDRPIGRRIALGSSGSAAPWREVIGIAGDVRQMGPGHEVEAQIYLPYGQRGMGRMNLVLGMETGGSLPAEAIRAMVREIAPDVPVDRIETLAGRYAETGEEARFLAALLTFFAGIGLLLATVGTYAIASHAQSRRTREVGIRMALGARASSVYIVVLGRVMAIAATGIVAGILLMLALGRFLEGHLHGVPARDPATLAASATLIVMAAALASFGPAARAARVDPNAVLRSE